MRRVYRTGWALTCSLALALLGLGLLADQNLTGEGGRRSASPRVQISILRSILPDLLEGVRADLGDPTWPGSSLLRHSRLDGNTNVESP